MSPKSKKEIVSEDGFVPLDRMVSERTAELLKSHMARDDLAESGDVLISGLGATRNKLNQAHLKEGARLFGRKNGDADDTFVVMALAEIEAIISKARQVSITAALAPSADFPVAERLPTRQGRHAAGSRHIRAIDSAEG